MIKIDYSKISPPVKTVDKEWNDDMRMDVLFAPFRDRQLNPVHYDSKMKFWYKAIVDWMRDHDQLQFDSSEIVEVFLRKGKLPKCLDEVITNLLKEGKAISKSALLNNTLCTSYGDYIWSLLRMLAYPITLVSSNQSNKDDEHTENTCFIILELCAEKCDKLFDVLNEERYSPNNTQVFTMDRFKKYANTIGVKSKDLEIFTAYLTQKGKARKFQLENTTRQVLKLALNENNSTINALTDVENSAILLEDLECKLEREVSEIDTKISSLLAAARKSIGENKKSSALRCLRQKKSLEIAREKKETTLANVQTMLHELLQSDSNKSILEAYSTSTEALKKLSQTGELSVEKAEDIMDEMNETINEQMDLTEALSKTIAPSIQDNFDLEQELADLLEDQEIDDLKLPDVPVESPTKTDKYAVDVLQPDSGNLPTNLDGNSEAEKKNGVSLDSLEEDISRELRKIRERINDLNF
ncbi:hypothetical protein GJ496_002457 [Pomphorhynchus laevis]|nr:hypothetical protein GJ496_002457 [Pomphorhynchus laevis]